VVTVTNLPSRPAPVLARTVTSLSALSGGRIVLGVGAGSLWDMIVKLGVPRLNGESAVRALKEAITLIRALSGGGDPVSFDGRFYGAARRTTASRRRCSLPGSNDRPGNPGPHQSFGDPTGWEDVWICPDPAGHIQAIGIDSAGRRQYRYHDQWREQRDRRKHDRMLGFGAALPRIRTTVQRHLAGRGLSRERVLAASMT
jgi:Luciferase-like monooxygenase/Bacterial DNA topoisomerase IB, N-terminal domain